MNILNHDDCRVLLHLIYRGSMTFDMCVRWAFDQYTDEGIDPKIEAIGLAYDRDDLYKVVRDFIFHAPLPSSNIIDIEFLLGEAYSLSQNEELDQYCREPVREIIERYHEDIPLPTNERKLILDALDFHNIYGGHETPKYEHLNRAEHDHMEYQWNKVLEICKDYFPIYSQAVNTFIQN